MFEQGHIEIRWTPGVAIVQNPHSLCPPELLAAQRLISVPYVDFFGEPHMGAIVMHESVVDDVRLFFAAARNMELPIERVEPAVAYGFDDEAMMAANNTSGFNYRTIMGTHQPSLHAGWAFDVNPQQNPYIRYANGRATVYPDGAQYDPSRPGTLFAQHPLVLMMKKRGWDWGGDWLARSGRVDYQHFQKQLTK